MKVNVNLNVSLDGPEAGYLNVYKATKVINGAERIVYITGKKAYPTESAAIRNASPAIGWTRVGIIPVEYYRNRVNSRLNEYQDAIHKHIVHDIDKWLAGEVQAIAPTPVSPVVTKEFSIPSQPKVKASKAKAPAKKPAKAKGKAPAKASKAKTVRAKRKVSAK